MKKIISILLIAAMLIPFASIGSFAASDAYKATWNFKTSVYDKAASESADKTNFTNGGSTVYDSKTTANVNVYPGQVVWVTVHLKTGSSYYVGELQTKIYYSNSIFQSPEKNNDNVWNTKSKYYSVCDDAFCTPYALITDKKKAAGYPSSWSDSKKSSYEFFTFGMGPQVGKKTPAGIDEDIVSFPIYVKSNAKVGSTGEVFITQDDLRTSKNTKGAFFLSYYENGDTSKSPVVISDKISHDTSKAKITYTVCDNGTTPPAESGTSFFEAIINFFKTIWNFITGLFSSLSK